MHVAALRCGAGDGLPRDYGLFAGFALPAILGLEAHACHLPCPDSRMVFCSEHVFQDRLLFSR